MEKDPNGVDQHAPGAKLDEGKPRVGLMFKDFSQALLEVAKVTTIGAKKYCPGGWRLVENGFERYSDAVGRHQLKEATELIDEDTGMLHAAQVAWNALARLELLIDERKQ